MSSITENVSELNRMARNIIAANKRSNNGQQIGISSFFVPQRFKRGANCVKKSINDKQEEESPSPLREH